MATKVDRTASMLCRRHGCSSEKITERMLEAEARVAELEAAADEVVAALNEWMGDTEEDDQRLEAALARYQAVKKGEGAK